jgi:hypothetical protein
MMRRLLSYLAALSGAILLPAAAAAQAPREAPTWARGGAILAVSHGACMARAALAMQAQGLTVTSNAAGVVLARKGAHLAIITCGYTADSRIDLNIVVASNGDTSQDSAALRDALQAAMSKPSCCE